MSQKFEGIFPYLVSPVDNQGNVKEQELARLVEHLIACGVHGLTPLGSTGELRGKLRRSCKAEGKYVRQEGASCSKWGTLRDWSPHPKAFPGDLDMPHHPK